MEDVLTNLQQKSRVICLKKKKKKEEQRRIKAKIFEKIGKLEEERL